MSYKHKYIRDYLIEYTTDDGESYDMVFQTVNEKIAIEGLKDYLNNLGISDFKIISIKKMATFPIYEAEKI